MRRPLLVCVLLVLATLTAYWPVREAGFLNFDDNQYVTNNPRVFQGLTPASIRWAFTTFHASNWHPLTWLSHMLDCQLFGHRSAAHHWVNVAFHCANATVLFLLLWRMTSAFARSAIVAGLFALHPLHVESVAWISERKDVLSAFFFLLTLWAYVKYASLKGRVSADQFSHAPRSTLHAADAPRSSPCPYLFAILFYALGLMAKPMLVTLPFILLLLDYWPLGRLRFSFSPAAAQKLRTAENGLWTIVREKLPFFTLSIASCIITFCAQKTGGAVVAFKDAPIEARLENSCIAYLFYLAKTFWPTRLAIFYPYPDHFRPEAGIAAALALIAITVLLFRFVRRLPYLFIGWLWFVGMLVPVIGLVQVGSQVAADRYTYLPLVGIFIALVWGLSDLVSRGPHRVQVLAPAAAAMLAACLVATFFQVRSWRDSITVFTRALAVGPKANPIVEHNLGHALSLRGDQPAAIAHFKQALRYVPEFPAAHLNWGNSVGALGNVEEAIQHYHDAIRFQPGYEEAHYQLGNAYALQGKFDEAEASFREAIRWKPDYAEAFLKLANVLDLKGKVDEARSNWSIALKYRPDYDEAHYYLAGSLAREKKFPEAIFHFRVALKSNPTYARALNDLAWILATQDDSKIRKVPDAIHFAEKACRLTNRTNANYLDTFAVALSEAGRFPEATTIASNALRIAELADSSAVSSELQKHLELFKAGKPYREGSQGH